MTSLTNEQKHLLFDYCMGLASEKEIAKAQKLISVNTEAAQIYAKLKSALSPLETIEHETCPDELAEGTIFRLNNLARASQLRLQQLLETEQARTVATASNWRNFGQMLAMAAAIILISGIFIAPLKYARQLSWQQACQMQLKRIWQGINTYSTDHDGRLPSVATTTGAPWWKVGYQGEENHSNTRHIWLLAKDGYVNPSDFVCPGKSQGRITRLDPAKAKLYNDFPARRYVTYSFRIKCNKPSAETLGPRVLISDSNPLFERLPQNYSTSLKIKLNNALSRLNSTNHNRCGQNLLFSDGSVNFAKTRKVGLLQDDIFTLQNTNEYKGIEVPSCTTDVFLAP